MGLVGEAAINGGPTTMTRETIYSSPDGDGPTVVRETTCKGCKYLDAVAIGSVCGHPTQGHHLLGFTTTTPSWCPIVSADPEVWQQRLKGGE